MSKKQAAQSRAERAAVAVTAQRQRERRRQLLLVGGVAVVLMMVVGIGFWIQSGRDTAGAPVTAPAGAVDEYALGVGDPEAPDTVVVYEDFLCPFCAEFETQTHDRLAELAADGKVYVEYRPFNLLRTPYSMAAANAFAVVLDRSGPEAALTFHDRLFAEQPDESGPHPDSGWLVEQAVAAGADEAEVTQPIEDLAFEQWVVNATDAASRAGVNSTPTVLLNGSPVDNTQGVDAMAADLLGALG